MKPRAGWPFAALVAAVPGSIKLASMPIDLVTWLRERCREYSFDVAGVFHRAGIHEWPLSATDATDLHAQLAAGGHLLPLPKEPAALANVLEVSVVAFLL